MELPPLTRGIHPVPCVVEAGYGITPARSGNTWSASRSDRLGRNYPRMCGEYARRIVAAPAQPELPPLARGIQLFALFLSLHVGITPACAGNTALCPFSFPACWNYPRLRGEYSLVVPPNIAAMELPPLARGILIHTPPTLNHCGITPACAGNTANPAPCIRVYRNYPRLRGEYSSIHHPP